MFNPYIFGMLLGIMLLAWAMFSKFKSTENSNRDFLSTQCTDICSASSL